MVSTWGIRWDERTLSFPGDKVAGQFDAALYRGVTIHATPEVVFRWLCQLRVAPYSYDWLDNLGRRSPQSLLPGLDRLSVGQNIMDIFRLISFEPGKHLTLRVKRGTRAARIFGDIVVCYLIIPQVPGSCRLLVKLLGRYPHGPVGWVMRQILPWGDLLMMRRQLLNFKKLAERSGR